MPKVGALLYLQQELNDKGDFFASYKNLSDKDKQDLKDWAEREQDALGLK